MKIRLAAAVSLLLLAGCGAVPDNATTPIAPVAKAKASAAVALASAPACR